MSIKDMSFYDRPREKASLYGLENLSNAELLAILISTGTKNCSALDIAYSLLSKFKGINGIIKAHTKELTTIKGINFAKALRIHTGLYLYERALLEDRAIKIDMSKTQSIGEYFVTKIGKLTQEVGYVVVVNHFNKPIKIVELFKGTMKGIASNPHLILKEVIGIGEKFYFVHNHPSGKLIPSELDLKFTSDLDMLSLTMRIELVDHLIVNDKDFLSLKKYCLNEVKN